MIIADFKTGAATPLLCLEALKYTSACGSHYLWSASSARLSECSLLLLVFVFVQVLQHQIFRLRYSAFSDYIVVINSFTDFSAWKVTCRLWELQLTIF